MKHMWRFALKGLAVGVLLFAFSLIAQVGSAQTGKDEGRAKAEEQALNLVATVAERANRQVIMEYRGSGTFMLPNPIQIDPKVSPRADATQTLKLMLANDSRFQITTGDDGVIRIVESGIPRDVLSIHIKQVVFTEEQQYDSRLAMNAILNSPEVQVYFKKNRVFQPIDIGGLVAGPAPGRPHLDSKMEDLTVLDAIKRVLMIFHHLAYYKESAKGARRRYVEIGFVDAD